LLDGAVVEVVAPEAGEEALLRRAVRLRLGAPERAIEQLHLDHAASAERGPRDRGDPAEELWAPATDDADHGVGGEQVAHGMGSRSSSGGWGGRSSVGSSTVPQASSASGFAIPSSPTRSSNAMTSGCPRRRISSNNASRSCSIGSQLAST